VHFQLSSSLIWPNNWATQTVGRWVSSELKYKISSQIGSGVLHTCWSYSACLPFFVSPSSRYRKTLRRRSSEEITIYWALHRLKKNASPNAPRLVLRSVHTTVSTGRVHGRWTRPVNTGSVYHALRLVIETSLSTWYELCIVPSVYAVSIDSVNYV